MGKNIYICDGEGYLNDEGNYVTIHWDCDCDSPRSWDGNLGTFLTWMSHHVSPDDNPFDGFDDLGAEYGIRCDDDPNEFVAKFNAKVGVCIPVFAIDHSGVAYRAAWANPFHDPWDSGFVGVVFATKERIRETFQVKRVTQKVRNRVIDDFIAEVDEYSAWAEGSCYGFVVHDKDDNEVDSCWGFIGMDAVESGLAEQCNGLNDTSMSLDEWLAA